MATPEKPDNLSPQAAADAQVIAQYLKYQAERGKLGYGFNSTAEIPIVPGSKYEQFIKAEQTKAQDQENKSAAAQHRQPRAVDLHIPEVMNKGLDIGWTQERGGSSLDADLRAAYKGYLAAKESEKAGSVNEKAAAPMIEHMDAQRMAELMANGRENAIALVQKKRDVCADPATIKQLQQMIQNYENLDQQRQRPTPPPPRRGGVIDV